MKSSAALILGLWIPMSVSATTPLPYASQCDLMGRLSATAVTQIDKRALALELLERVADGRTDQIGSESEGQVGVPIGTLRQTVFAEPTVRACALRKIGETGLPEAVEFLANLKQAEIGTDSGQQIWPAAQVALHDARLRRVGPQFRIGFLESVLTEPHDAVSNSAIGHWAVDELCDRGALECLPVIQQSVRNRMNGQRDDDEIRFCEARIQVIRRNPDRVKALGSALALGDGVDDTRLRLWAIYQLDVIHSSEADAELGRFENDIRHLPMQSPARQRLSVIEGAIQEVRNRRAARSK